MTGQFEKVYEETYSDHLIEIYQFSQFTPGGVGTSYLIVNVDGERLPENFDVRSHRPFQPSATNPDSSPDPVYSSALAAARTYCDRTSLPPNTPP